MKELKEQYPILAEQCSFDEPEEVDTLHFSTAKDSSQMKN